MYCTRRLRRIRKSLGFTQGHRHRYHKRELKKESITEVRFLYLPLVCAERAWALGMELKQESHTEPRKRFHLLRRLNKAAKYANELLHLSEGCGRCDARTRLEAEVHVCTCISVWSYAYYMYVSECGEFISGAGILSLDKWECTIWTAKMERSSRCLWEISVSVLVKDRYFIVWTKTHTSVSVCLPIYMYLSVSVCLSVCLSQNYLPAAEQCGGYGTESCLPAESGGDIPKYPLLCIQYWRHAFGYQWADEAENWCQGLRYAGIKNWCRKCLLCVFVDQFLHLFVKFFFFWHSIVVCVHFAGGSCSNQGEDVCCSDRGGVAGKDGASKEWTSETITCEAPSDGGRGGEGYRDGGKDSSVRRIADGMPRRHPACSRRDQPRPGERFIVKFLLA